MNDVDLSLFEDPELACSNIPFLEPPSANDFHVLSSEMDQISVDVNTQHLRRKLEKSKRQRLSLTIKNIEREIAALSNIITQTQTNITKLNLKIESLLLMRNGDLAQLTTITYRCLSRMHNIIIATLPHIAMPTRSHEDLVQLAHELLRTIYQLPIPQTSEVQREWKWPVCKYNYLQLLFSKINVYFIFRLVFLISCTELIALPR